MPNLSDDEIRGRIAAEPETRKIADALGISIDDYVERVLHYVKNPNAQPQLQTMSDAEASEHGLPTVQESLAYVDKLASGEISLDPEEHQTRYTGFDDEEKSAVTAAGGNAEKRAPRAAPSTPAPTTSAGPRRGLKKP